MLHYQFCDCVCFVKFNNVYSRTREKYFEQLSRIFVQSREWQDDFYTKKNLLAYGKTEGNSAS